MAVIQKQDPIQQDKIMSFNFDGMNNVLDTSSVGNDPTQATLLQNVDVMTDGSIRRRNGFTLSAAGTIHSGWNGGFGAYVVDGTAIKTFNGTSLSAPIVTVAPTLPMSFCQVGDIVVYSNGVDFGVIEGGAALDPFIPVNPFKVPMHPGQLLEFYNGRLYSFYNETLYCSDSLDSGGGVEQMDTRANIVAVFDSRGTMVKAVNNGLWVGTDTETVFLQGNDAFADGGFTFIPTAPYGVCFNSAVSVKGELLGAKDKTVVWASHRGICVGGNSGSFENKSQGKVAYKYGDGAAFLREENGLVHYLCTMNASNNPYNIFEGTNVQLD